VADDSACTRPHNRSRAAAADIQDHEYCPRKRIVGTTKNVDPRHPAIMLRRSRNRQDSWRRLWISRPRGIRQLVRPSTGSGHSRWHRRSGWWPFDRLRAHFWLVALRQAQGAFLLGQGPVASSDLGPRLAKYVAQNLLHLVELRLATDQWGSDLDNGIAAIIDPAIKAVLVRRACDVAA
jgi:hypothetical protein